MTMIDTVLEQIQRMDNDELNRVIGAVKQRRTYNARNITRKLVTGDVVSFETKSGTITGTVRKVNPKTVLVKDRNSATTWKVTATLLTPLHVGG
jgi:putative ribosome biogenesis GTPase RsgA